MKIRDCFPGYLSSFFWKLGYMFFNRWFVLTLAPDSERCFVSRVRVNDRDGSATTSAEDSVEPLFLSSTSRYLDFFGEKVLDLIIFSHAIWYQF